MRIWAPAPLVEAITEFPFLFGGTFIEDLGLAGGVILVVNFPSFSEGLSLRILILLRLELEVTISLPFRRDFH